MLDAELAKVEVKFTSYYKYSFSFSNDDGYMVSAGGNADDIYRCDIEATKVYTIQEIANECGGNLFIYLKDKLIYEDSG